MFDFIPVEFYTPFYYYVLFFVVLLTFLSTQMNNLFSKKSFFFQNNIGIIVFIFVTIYMGLRPIDGVFIDMTTYNFMFEKYAEGAKITTDRDVFFHSFTKFSSGIMTANFYFLLCAILYVLPLYLVSKKWFKKNWFYGFMFFITAFSFWAYGTNGIRNGIAGSIFLLGVSREKRLHQVLLIILAINFHQTMLLPALAFGISNFYNKPKLMIAVWIICIPFSLVSGGLFETFIAGLGFGDDRISYLTDEAEEGRFASTGFRWDFLIYSSTAIFAGWFYIIKKKYNDRIYFYLFNTYVIANAFWILVIRANFSNRFAYLSWFMIGLIIIYPLLKEKLVIKQHKIIGFILLLYFAFTFFMNVILN